MQEILCGDIGGTNANLCLAALPLSKYPLTSDQISLRYKKKNSTQEQPDFSTLVNTYLKESLSQTEAACFAVAGPVKEARVEMTNSRLVIDVKELLEKTPLKKVLLINDFEALGYATNILLPEETQQINPNTKSDSKSKRIKAILGAGTGLGKALLLYDSTLQAYCPIPSEGGHGDLPLRTQEEFELVKALSQPTYEDLLSGRGLEFLYQQLEKKPPYLNAHEISATRATNPASQKTFEWFVFFYARCAKNFAIDLLAEEIFLAGGIGAANSDIFNGFMTEFTRHPLPKFQEILEKIPVTLITNYDVSLKGAAFAFYAQMHKNDLI